MVVASVDAAGKATLITHNQRATRNPITMGVYKACDSADSMSQLCKCSVTPHLAQCTSRRYSRVSVRLLPPKNFNS